MKLRKPCVQINSSDHAQTYKLWIVSVHFNWIQLNALRFHTALAKILKKSLLVQRIRKVSNIISNFKMKDKPVLVIIQLLVPWLAYEGWIEFTIHKTWQRRLLEAMGKVELAIRSEESYSVKSVSCASKHHGNPFWYMHSISFLYGENKDIQPSLF